MAKWWHPIMGTVALTFMSTAVNRIMIGSNQPTTYAEGNTYAVGTLADTSGNWTIQVGDTGTSVKATHAAATITVGTTSTVNHVYFMTTTGSGTLLFVGTCAPTAVTSGGTVILSSWDVDEIQNVT